MAVDLVGTEILGYEIKELLGEGGMASVWRAEQPTLETEVAIKVLDPSLAKDNNLVARFMDEAKIQVKLRHPNVVKIENFSMDNLAMVMELVAGSALDEVIGREVGPIPFQRAMPMIQQILAAVGAAHEMNIVHRDLKPSNIIKTPEGKIKVMDFGIAKVLGARGRTRTGTTMGTPDYMAPEQIKGAKDVGPAADIYALGVTFYEMLSGRTPFMMDPEADSEFEIMEAQVYKKPPDPREFYPGIPEEVVAVVMKALEKKPEDRYQSVEELKYALEQASGMEGETWQAEPTPTPAPVERPDPPKRKKPAAETVIESPDDPLTLAAPAPSAALAAAPGPAAAPAAAHRMAQPPRVVAPPAAVEIDEPVMVPQQGLSTGVKVGLGGLGAGGLVVFVVIVMLVSGGGDGGNTTPPEPTSHAVIDPAPAHKKEAKPPEPTTPPRETRYEPPPVVSSSSCSIPGVPAIDLSDVSPSVAKRARKANTRGFRLYKKRNLRGAMAYWKNALRVHPGHILARYNLACGFALTGERHKAMCLLEEIKANLSDWRCKKCQKQINHARTDSDFNSLRGNPRFSRIIQ